MIGQGMIRRLSLFDQRCNDLVFLMQFPLCHVNAASGVPELFAVLSVCKTSVVGILMCNGAVVDLFGTSIADIRGLVEAITAFFFEVLAGLIAGGARSAFDTAEDDLAAESGKKYACIRFNGWKHQGFEDSKVALMSSIISELEKKKNLVRRLEKY